ncbi:MAG: S4 domain-containing protein [Dokdonella sp.]
MIDVARGVRLDVWLWAARFYKTRYLAKVAVEGGKIDVGEVSAKPARLLQIGDRLRITRGDERFVIDVLALADKRGPASAAQALYAETAQSRTARDAMREMRRLTGAGFSHPPTRPDKHSRRLLRGFKEGLS